MNVIFKAVADHLPRRKRRFWRYVSGHRRRRGIALFALIILGAYGWWYLTNDRRIRREAEQYLHRLTGATIRIHKASFSVLGGIRLTQVRLFFEDDDRIMDVFQAREVHLRYKPLSLLRGTKLSVKEIICIDPVLTVTQDVDKERWNYQRFFRGRLTVNVRMMRGDLPIIRIRGAQLRRNEIIHGLLLPVGVERLGATAVPKADGATYVLTVEGNDFSGDGTLNMETGKLQWRGEASFTKVPLVLSRKYRQWCDRYQVSGRLNFEGQSASAGSGGRQTAQLIDVSMTLPAEQGGLTLTHLNGKAVFANQRVTIESVTGRLAQLGDATVNVTGWFAGLDAAGGTFELTVASDDLRFPLTLPTDSTLGGIWARVQRAVTLTGPARIAVEVAGDAEGVTVTGTAWPKNMHATVQTFPYPLEDVSGTIEFDAERIVFADVQARGGSMRVTCDGEIRSPMKNAVFDLTIDTRDVPFNDELRQAMRPPQQRLYDSLAPRGRCAAEIKVSGPARPRPATDVTVILDTASAASVEFESFPYRIHDLSGRIHFAKGKVEFDSLRGRRGQAQVSLSRRVTGCVWASAQVVSDLIDSLRGRRGQAQVSLLRRLAGLRWPSAQVILGVRATGLPLDDHLRRALPASARKYYEAFQPAGTADVVGRLIQRKDRPLDYNIVCTLKGADLTYDGCPLRQASGVVRFTPEQAYIDRIVGTCGQGTLSVCGDVLLNPDGVGLDLVFDGTGVDLAAAPRSSLPPAMAKTWKELAPTGTVDLELELVSDAGPANGRDAYTLDLRARALSLVCPPLGRRIDGLQGRILARPGRVELTNITSAMTQPYIAIQGTLVIEDGKVELIAADPAGGPPSLLATSVPIDRELLQALPVPIKRLSEYLSPGGECGIRLDELLYDSKPSAADDGANAPASRPAASGRLRVAGAIDLDKAKLGVSLGGTQVTGKIEGAASSHEKWEQMRVDATFDLDGLSVLGREVRQVKGEIHKSPEDKFLRIDGLGREAWGGQIAGEIELALQPDLKYALEMVMENVELDELWNVDADDPGKRIPMPGIVRGKLELSGFVGEVKGRLGEGKLVITKAKIAQVPLLVGLVNIVFLQLPGRFTFNTCTTEYRIKDDKIIFSNIHLSGGGTSIVGSGTIDTTTRRLSLVFASGPPWLIPGVFEELWPLVAKGLLAFEVTGTVRQPVVKAVPFSQIKKLLKEVAGAG